MNKYIFAQKEYIQTVINELKNGKKVSHWIWFIFPQLKGLGKSIFSDYYGLSDLNETKQYYLNKFLRNNLNKCLQIIYSYTDVELIINCLGDLDTKKLHSCVTLFYLATKKNIFKKIIDKFFNGLLDNQTLSLLTL